VKRHVDFLSTLFQVWGAIFVLVAVAGFALAAGAAAIATSSGAVRFGSEMAARLTAVSIGVIAIIALVWGLLHYFVGRRLGQYRPSARLMSLGLAIGNLILFPFGTALGGYACWVLLKDEGRSLFEH
jgi:threonine/homoserine efflux transporter RhtA